jgi:hypothetical protein
MQDKDNLRSEIITGVTFATFMGAVSLFFTGLLISQFDSFDKTMRVPVLFLIISTFAYIFSAAIYSNAGAEVTSNEISIVKKYLIYANNIFEFLGLYLFLLATPLVIGAVTKDSFLRITTVVVSLVGLALYSSSNFSVLHKEMRDPNIKHFLTITLVGLAALLDISQFSEQRRELFSYNYLASILLLVLVGITYLFCKRSKQYSTK